MSKPRFSWSADNTALLAQDVKPVGDRVMWHERALSFAGTTWCHRSAAFGQAQPTRIGAKKWHGKTFGFYQSENTGFVLGLDHGASFPLSGSFDLCAHFVDPVGEDASRMRIAVRSKRCLASGILATRRGDHVQNLLWNRETGGCEFMNRDVQWTANLFNVRLFPREGIQPSALTAPPRETLAEVPFGFYRSEHTGYFAAFGSAFEFPLSGYGRFSFHSRVDEVRVRVNIDVARETCCAVVIDDGPHDAVARRITWNRNSDSVGITEIRLVEAVSYFGLVVKESLPGGVCWPVPPDPSATESEDPFE